jgi:hypothetical protein
MFHVLADLCLTLKQTPPCTSGIILTMVSIIIPECMLMLPLGKKPMKDHLQQVKMIQSIFYKLTICTPIKIQENARISRNY